MKTFAFYASAYFCGCILAHILLHVWPFDILLVQMCIMLVGLVILFMLTRGGK
jgi:hypothetical protein